MAAPVIPILLDLFEESVRSHVLRVILFGTIPTKADTESEHAEQRPKRHESLAVHDAMVLRWKEMVASRPSSPSGSSSYDTLALSSKFSLALVVVPPMIRRRPGILIRPGPSTRVVSPRLVYLPVMTPRDSEAFRRWRSSPLSTPYLLMTLESSLDSSSESSLDSSSPSSGPSRKRCRSPTTLVPYPFLFRDC
nr:hypothetical protein [Tanacetum cinerariifolium]